MKSPQWLRNIKTKKTLWKIFSDKQPQLIENAGWHFSFLKTPDSIIKKIKSYAHQEFNKSEFIDKDKIKNKISKGLDLFERDIKYNIVELDDTFPEYIVKNKVKFKDWIA